MVVSELITSTDMPARSPDLVVTPRDEAGWVVEQVSRRFADWLGIGDLEVRGHGLRELFTDVRPGLDYLADEVLKQGRLSAIPVHFHGERDLQLLAEISTGGHAQDYRQRQVHFHFQIMPTGRARQHVPVSRFGLVGISPGMQEVFRKIELYAVSDAAVIVTGETGTGKELVARALHEQGPRKQHSFVAVNCSAISPELLESELFGHEKGAFTGAARTHRGRFERAHQGTMFLDEIGDMPAHAQVKLLRVLEEGCLERVGGERPIPVDVRVVGATNVPLEQAVRDNRFRSDLYHRLAVLRIHLPALRQRPEDIPLLTEHFLAQFRRKYSRHVERLTHEAMTLLQAYLWPGNVRELRNVLERVFIESQADVIGARAFKDWVYERQDFSPGDWGPQSMGDARPLIPPYPLANDRPLLADQERLAITGPAGHPVELPRRTTKPADLDEQEIRLAYQRANGNLTATARLLGVHRATLYRYLKKLHLSRDQLDG